MIQLMFELGSEVILITIKGNEVKFSNTMFGAIETDIGGLKLDYAGVCREFPDLETEKDWRERASERFKKKVNSFDNEEEIADYLIKDLQKFGYIPKKKQKEGFRPEKI